MKGQHGNEELAAIRSDTGRILDELATKLDGIWQRGIACYLSVFEVRGTHCAPTV